MGFGEPGVDHAHHTRSTRGREAFPDPIPGHDDVLVAHLFEPTETLPPIRANHAARLHFIAHHGIEALCGGVAGFA